MATLFDEREGIFDALRRWGYLQAHIDPFGSIKPEPVEELPAHSELEYCTALRGLTDHFCLLSATIVETYRNL